MQFNEILEGSLNQILTRRLAMQGAAPSPALMPEVSPTLVLENDRPEWQYLANGKLMMANAFVAAAVGNPGQVLLKNPAGSGALVVIERFDAQSVSATEVYRVAGATASFVTRALGYPRDFRYPYDVSGTGLWLGGALEVSLTNAFAALPAGALLGMRRYPSATAFTELDLILPPGTAALLSVQTVNTAADFNIFWRERRAEQGELA